jgi:AraC-like DNA-binding protein
MGYHSFVPHPALTPYIESIWHYTGDVGHCGLERILPTGAADMVISARDEPLALFRSDDPTRFDQVHGPVFYGPHTTYNVIERTAGASVYGVHFRPGGAGAFVSLPLGELQNTALSLEYLWRSEAERLSADVLRATTPNECVQAIERALLNRFAPAKAPNTMINRALRALRAAPEPINIATLADVAGLSTRRFGQIFAAEVGLSPKLFQRVLRFQNALEHAEHDDARTWARVATACGYYDQAHFIHDFHSFTGLSPSVYAALRGPWRNHVAHH